jgi:hypothetical protein
MGHAPQDLKYRPGLSDQIIFDLIQFWYKRCRNLLIWFEIDSIQFTIRLDRTPCCSVEKNYCNHEICHSLRGHTPGCQKQLAKSFVIPFCKILTFYCHCFWFFGFKMFSKSNQIVSKIEKKKPFDWICIRLDSIWAKTFDLITEYD